MGAIDTLWETVFDESYNDADADINSDENVLDTPKDSENNTASLESNELDLPTGSIKISEIVTFLSWFLNNTKSVIIAVFPEVMDEISFDPEVTYIGVIVNVVGITESMRRIKKFYMANNLRIAIDNYLKVGSNDEIINICRERGILKI